MVCILKIIWRKNGENRNMRTHLHNRTYKRRCQTLKKILLQLEKSRPITPQQYFDFVKCPKQLIKIDNFFFFSIRVNSWFHCTPVWWLVSAEQLIIVSVWPPVIQMSHGTVRVTHIQMRSIATSNTRYDINFGGLSRWCIGAINNFNFVSFISYSSIHPLATTRTSTVKHQNTTRSRSKFDWVDVY